MSFFEIFALATALAMDCFTISIASGIIMKKLAWNVAIRTSLLFGLFQGLLPLAGWASTVYFEKSIKSADHWIAFVILAFLGIRMIRESFKKDGCRSFDPSSLKTQLLLAIATSIDALAVGVSFTCVGYVQIAQLAIPLLTITLVAFAFSLFGFALGVYYEHITKRINPELAGGTILLFIGLKILIGHLATGS